MNRNRPTLPFCISLFSLGILLAAPAIQAQFVLDGSRDADYGAPLTVQTVETQFGDNFSELNAAYGVIAEDNLYLLLTGQVEDNFNKLNIFIDSVPGGQNVVDTDANNGGTNPENDNWAIPYEGLTFDAGFAADFMIIARNGNAGGDQFNLDLAVIGGGLGAFESTTDIFGGSLTGVNASVGPSGIGVGYDNSNMAGVLGGTAAADQVAAAAVTTGLELVIPLAAIGSPGPGDTILITAHINNGDHNFLSNQSLAGYAPPQINLGGDGGGGFTGNLSGIDLNQFEGPQYFSIGVPVPENRATFLVSKGFDDGNPAEVEVTLSCNTGLPLEQTTMISEGDPVDFVVVDFNPGEMDCDVFETVPDGYQPDYNASGDSPSSEDENGCHFTEVGAEHANACAIDNRLQPVLVVVGKEWIDERPEYQLQTAVEITLRCSNADILGGFACGPDDCRETFIDPDNPGQFQVFPHWDGSSSCQATEDPQAGVLIDESDCESIPVAPGQGGECTIVNTRLFAGIPTLGQYGLVVLALLLLGLGFISLRRFA